MITIDSVVRSNMGDTQNPTLHGYVSRLHYALRGFQELSFDVIAEVKTAELTLNEIYVAKLPTDYVKLVRVFAKVGDRISEMSEDGSITFHHEGTKTPNEAFYQRRSLFTLGNSTTTRNPLNGLEISSKGKGHNNKGYFRENKGTFPRELQFDSGVTSRKIFVEYLATPETPGSETALTPLAANCLNEYIHYRDSRHKNGESSYETQSLKQSFERERSKLFARESNLTLTGIIDAYKQAYGENQLR